VKGRWNDNRHILVTELAESGAAMLALLHVRMDANRRTLDEIAARQRAADEKRSMNSSGSSRLRWSLHQRWFSNR
jgi:hypothetical protein